MAVPFSKRSKSKFKVLIEAQDLYKYTMQIMSNEKTFNPSYKHLINSILDETQAIYTNAYAANKIVVTDELYDLVLEILNKQYVEDVGYNPGSQMIQIAAISLLNSLDHLIKDTMLC